MSHNVCYCNKIRRPKSMAIYENDRWAVNVGDLVRARVVEYHSDGCHSAWFYGEVYSLNRGGIAEVLIPKLGRLYVYDMRFNHDTDDVRKCFDAAIGAFGEVLKIGDTVCEVEDLYHLDYKVIKVDGSNLLCRHESANGSVKYPALWLDARKMETIEMEKMKNEK